MNITYFRVFLGILGHYSIQYLNFAKKWFNSLFNSKISRKFNSKKYSIQKFARKFNSKKYSIQKFAIQKIFNSKICKKIQFKIWFKILNLAGFNSTIYSFNNKTWVSLTPTSSMGNVVGLNTFVSESTVPKYLVMFLCETFPWYGKQSLITRVHRIRG